MIPGSAFSASFCMRSNSVMSAFSASFRLRASVSLRPRGRPRPAIRSCPLAGHQRSTRASTVWACPRPVRRAVGHGRGQPLRSPRRAACRRPGGLVHVRRPQFERPTKPHQAAKSRSHGHGSHFGARASGSFLTEPDTVRATEMRGAARISDRPMQCVANDLTLCTAIPVSLRASETPSGDAKSAEHPHAPGRDGTGQMKARTKSDEAHIKLSSKGRARSRARHLELPRAAGRGLERVCDPFAGGGTAWPLILRVAARAACDGRLERYGPTTSGLTIRSRQGHTVHEVTRPAAQAVAWIDKLSRRRSAMKTAFFAWAPPGEPRGLRSKPRPKRRDSRFVAEPVTPGSRCWIGRPASRRVRQPRTQASRSRREDIAGSEPARSPPTGGRA